MKMRAFIYSKVTNRKVAQINNIVDVQSKEDKVIFTTSEGEVLTFDTREVKATTYQN